MGKYTTVDYFESMTYWPFYFASMLISCFFCIPCIAVGIVIINLILDNNLLNGNLGVLIVFCILLILALVVVLFLRKQSYTKVYISYTEIHISNVITNKNKYIKWEDVFEIHYYENEWYKTAKYYKIFVNVIEEGKVCTVILPIGSACKERIARFFPAHITVVKG